MEINLCHRSDCKLVEPSTKIPTGWLQLANKPSLSSPNPLTTVAALADDGLLYGCNRSFVKIFSVLYYINFIIVALMTECGYSRKDPTMEGER